MNQWHKIETEISSLAREGKWVELYEQGKKCRELFQMRIFGCHVGQTVEYWESRWRRGVIKKIVSHTEIHVEDVTVPVSLVRNIDN